MDVAANPSVLLEYVCPIRIIFLIVIDANGCTERVNKVGGDFYCAFQMLETELHLKFLNAGENEEAIGWILSAGLRHS